jgi:hypothetical protein
LVRTIGWLATSAPPEIKAMCLGSVSDLVVGRLLARTQPAMATQQALHARQHTATAK